MDFARKDVNLYKNYSLFNIIKLFSINVVCTFLQTEYYNEDMEPVKRKLPSKSKGLNMTSKIRQTFTMCCTPHRDSSIEDATVNDVEKTVSEKRKGISHIITHLLNKFK